MSSNERQNAGRCAYCTPSLAADLFATLVGLALIYGMIVLVGNGLSAKGGKGHMREQGQTVHAAMGGERKGPAGPALDPARLAPLRRGSLAAFYLYAKPRALPAFSYVDEKGQSHSLEALRGKVVLLNLWATWCGPCRHEMAGLDQLQARYGGTAFKVLTIAVDRGGLRKPRRFFRQNGITHLDLYGDATGRLSATLRSFGLPTTLLIDRQGREVGRINGPAEWNAREAHAFVEAALGKGKTG